MGETQTDEAMGLVNRLAPELGLIVTDTQGFHKIVASSTKHYIYIQKSKRLGVINTSLPLPKEEPGTKALEKDNGSVTCHIVPELGHLERFLRMLGDASTEPFKATKNRPFAVTRPPAPRQPKPVVAPVPLSAIPASSPGDWSADPEDPRPAQLQARIALIQQQSRKARISRWMEHGLDRDLAEMVAAGHVNPDDAHESMRARRAAESHSDTVEGFAQEAGIEIPGGSE